MQEQLIELESTGKLPLATIETYKEHTTALSNALGLPRTPKLSQLVSMARCQAKQTVPVVKNPSIPPLMSTENAGGKVQDIKSEAKHQPIPLSSTAQLRLESQKKTQESLTDELVGLAAAMKSNTLALESKVHERGRLLDGTEMALNQSSYATKAAVVKAKAIHRRGRLNFCLSCLVILLICGGFAGMFVFIRVTSFVGYKKQSAKAAQPPLTQPPHSPSPLPNDEL